MTVVLALSSSDAPKNMNGAWGLLVFLLLAIVVFFLFRSMNKHLRKAQRMRDDDDQADDARRRDPTPPRPRKS
jgi:cbb3-type cytochrome oxidase subunit 3